MGRYCWLLPRMNTRQLSIRGSPHIGGTGGDTKRSPKLFFRIAIPSGRPFATIMQAPQRMERSCSFTSLAMPTTMSGGAILLAGQDLGSREGITTSSTTLTRMVVSQGRMISPSGFIPTGLGLLVRTPAARFLGCIPTFLTRTSTTMVSQTSW